jgi:hypothetical protein
MTLNNFCIHALRRESAGRPKPDSGQFIALGPILNSPLGVHLDGIVLFGSRSRDEAGANSDTDLMLCLSPDANLTRELYSQWDTLAAEQPDVLPPSLSPHFTRIPTSGESAGSLWLEVAVDGLVLRERAFCVSRALADLRRYSHMLTGWRSIREV